MHAAVNLADKLALFSDHWNPRIVGEVNDCAVKLAKFKGDFVWHKHDHEDEMFLVLRGSFVMRFRDRDVLLREGEVLIVPRGTEHMPSAEHEVAVMLFEPKATLNTGNVLNERTVQSPHRLP